MGKYVTFFSDFDIVAAAAAQAHQEMREFTIDEAKKLPLAGLTLAHVEVKARGILPIKRLNKRYVNNEAHLVLEIDGKVYQPIKKHLSAASQDSGGPEWNR